MPPQASDPAGGDLTLTLAPSDRAPALAREALRPLSGRLAEPTFETLRLLVTELIANSVRHAGLGRKQRIRLRVSLADGAVRAEVREPGPGFEADPSPAPGGNGGWGLFLVDRFARRWAVGRDGETTVWFELEA